MEVIPICACCATGKCVESEWCEHDLTRMSDWEVIVIRNPKPLQGATTMAHCEVCGTPFGDGPPDSWGVLAPR